MEDNWSPPHYSDHSGISIGKTFQPTPAALLTKSEVAPPLIFNIRIFYSIMPVLIPNELGQV